MEKKYLIKSFKQNGYYDMLTSSFRGYIFATAYDSKADALERIEHLIKDHPDDLYEIIPVYRAPF